MDFMACLARAQSQDVIPETFTASLELVLILAVRAAY